MSGNKNSGNKKISDGSKVIYLRIPEEVLNRIELERKKESFPRKLPNMILALTSEALDARSSK